MPVLAEGAGFAGEVAGFHFAGVVGIVAGIGRPDSGHIGLDLAEVGVGSGWVDADTVPDCLGNGDSVAPTVGSDPVLVD